MGGPLSGSPRQPVLPGASLAATSSGRRRRALSVEDRRALKALRKANTVPSPGEGRLPALAPLKAKSWEQEFTTSPKREEEVEEVKEE